MKVVMNIKADGGDGEVVLDISSLGVQLAVQQGTAKEEAEPPTAVLPVKVKKKPGRPKKLRRAPVPLLGHAEVERNGEVK